MRKSSYGCAMLFGFITLSGAALADPTGGMGMPHGGMMETGKDMRGEKMCSGKGHGMMMGGSGGDEDHYAHITSMHILGALGLKDDQRKKVMDLRRELRNNCCDQQQQKLDLREQLGMLY